MQPPLRVHLCPVGFERDRILTPAIDQRADRVHLILRDPERDAGHHADFLQEQLAAAGVQVERERCAYEMYALLGLFGDLIRRYEGQHVFINISTGGTIAAVAGTLAGMMFGAQLYHVEPLSYIDTQRPVQAIEQALRTKDPKRQRELLQAAIEAHLQSTGGVPHLISAGVRQIVEIPRYRIETPPHHLLGALGYIGGRQATGRRTRKKDLIAFLEQTQPEQFHSERLEGRDRSMSLQQKYGILQTRFLAPLQRWGYLTAGGSRNAAWLVVTEPGLRALRIFGEAATQPSSERPAPSTG